MLRATVARDAAEPIDDRECVRRRPHRVEAAARRLLSERPLQLDSVATNWYLHGWVRDTAAGGCVPPGFTAGFFFG